MAKSIEKQLKLFEKKHKKMLAYGIKHKLIFTYPDALFNRLRPYQVGGFPASIMLFIIEMCNGKCYDRSLLMQLAFSDCQIIQADVETLRVTAGEEYAEHSFVVTKEFGGNKEWVVDTSMGLIYDKDYYFKFENPTINRIITKEECMNYSETKEIIAGDFENDKYSLPLYLSFIEQCIKNSKWLGTIIYREKVLSELEKFKQAIGYDLIKAEIDEDIKLMYTDSKKLDEKFKIVRDKYGREFYRNGVQNPYYISPEEADEKEKQFHSIKDDEKKLNEYIDKIVQESVEHMQVEYEKTSLIALKRLEEILANPTVNFYDKCAFACQDISNNEDIKLINKESFLGRKSKK